MVYLLYHVCLRGYKGVQPHVNQKGPEIGLDYRFGPLEEGAGQLQ